MSVIEVKSGNEVNVSIRLLTKADLKKLTKRRYFFNWKDVYGKADVYKLCLEEDEDIKGVLAIVDHPAEYRIEVKLIAVSRENVILDKEKGRGAREYENIASNLLAFSARIALSKYGARACLSLIPKTSLRDHYIRAYEMKFAGTSLYLDGVGLQRLATKHK